LEFKPAHVPGRAMNRFDFATTTAGSSHCNAMLQSHFLKLIRGAPKAAHEQGYSNIQIPSRHWFPVNLDQSVVFFCRPTTAEWLDLPVLPRTTSTTN